MDHRADLTDLERRLLDGYQQGLPLSSTPYADMAQALGVNEADVLTALGHLQNLGVLSRVGPVFRTHTVGASTLAAMAVPDARLEEVAAIVNSFAAVNHNYQREHYYNLWFVATADDDSHRPRAGPCAAHEVGRQRDVSAIAGPQHESWQR